MEQKDVTSKIYVNGKGSNFRVGDEHKWVGGNCIVDWSTFMCIFDSNYPLDPIDVDHEQAPPIVKISDAHHHALINVA